MDTAILYSFVVLISVVFIVPTIIASNLFTIRMWTNENCTGNPIASEIIVDGLCNVLPSTIGNVLSTEVIGETPCCCMFISDKGHCKDDPHQEEWINCTCTKLSKRQNLTTLGLLWNIDDPLDEEPPNDDTATGGRGELIVILCSTILLVIIVMAILLYWYKSHRRGTPGYLIPRECIFFDKGDPATFIGSGAYGNVHKGQLKRKGKPARDVAIKMLKPEFGYTFLDQLKNEIKLLTYLMNNEHENIVQFLGSCTGNVLEGEVFVVLQFCSMGNLLQYLWTMRQGPSIVSRKDTNYYKFYNHKEYLRSPVATQTKNMDPSLKFQFVTWGMQIAQGMEFLKHMEVLHVDLSARNILLDDNLTAKISDFSLSRRLNRSGIYHKQGHDLIPVKALALESLTENLYTTQSDIWGYGITLWEIFSTGEEPYSDIQRAPQLVQFLESGKRLDCPVYADEDIYKIMCQCWDFDPNKRPSFTVLQKYFKTLGTKLCI